MRKTRTNWQSELHRATALLLAFICLWISGGAVLHHSDDDLAPFLTFAAGRSFQHHAGPSLPSIPCAACQWEQTTPTPPAPGISIQHSALLRRTFAAAVPPFLHLISFVHTSPRAPPRLAG